MHQEIAEVIAGTRPWTVVTADCLDVLRELPSGSVDAVVTDPPYGVNLGKHASANEKRPRYLAKGGYANYDDTPENFDAVVVPAIAECLRIAFRSLVFTAGTQMWSLPRPSAVGGVYLPAGCGRSSWGFQCLAHFLMYGDCPDLHLGAKPVAWSSTATAEPSEHPCPKPTDWMRRCLLLASRPGDLILDPFCGSGTTGVACVQTGRRFIGIEIDEKYAAIARRRIADAAPLFVPVPVEHQPKLLETDP